MRRVHTLLSALLGVIRFPAVVVVGQTSTLTPARTPEQPFAAIDASLVHAVNSAIENASVTTPLVPGRSLRVLCLG